MADFTLFKTLSSEVSVRDPTSFQLSCTPSCVCYVIRVRNKMELPLYWSNPSLEEIADSAFVTVHRSNTIEEGIVNR